MPADFVQTYRAFAYNNAWANHRLLTACSGLSQADFEAERTGFFPSLQLTLNHIYVVDLFYVDALEGGWLGPKAWEDQVPCRSLAELKSAQAAVDRRLIVVCNALTPEGLDGIADTGIDPAAVVVPRSLIVRTSGDQMAIPDVRVVTDLDILNQIAFSVPALGDADGWNLQDGNSQTVG